MAAEDKHRRLTVKLRIHKSGSSWSYIVTIPKQIVDAVLKWEKGKTLAIEVVERNGKRCVLLYPLEGEE